MQLMRKLSTLLQQNVCKVSKLGVDHRAEREVLQQAGAGKRQTMIIEMTNTIPGEAASCRGCQPDLAQRPSAHTGSTLREGIAC